MPPSRCGVGDYTRSLAAALSARPGLEVAVLADAPGLRDEFEILVPRHGWRLSALFAIVRQIRQWRPDLVHIQYPAQGYGSHHLPYLLPLLLRLAGVRNIQTWHEYRPEWNPIHLLNALLARAIVVVRPRFRENLSALVRRLVSPRKFRYVPNASSIPPLALDAAARERIRTRFGPGRRIVTYFGFVYEHKGVDLLFDVSDPSRDMLILACELSESDDYHRRIRALASSARWAGHCVITGFLPPREIGEILAASDAVVLPFRRGGGGWNTSLHAAQSQGTFVLTTSNERHGYDSASNVYAAAPDDVDEMRRALETHAGRRVPPLDHDPWDDIAAAHEELYRSLMPDGR